MNVYRFTNESDYYLTISSLRLAADQFDRDAQRCAYASLTHNGEYQMRVALQFKDQAAAARRIADAIENGA